MENVKQTINKVFPIGKLKEKNIEFKVSKTGKEMAIGNIVILIENGEMVGEQKIKIMQFKYKADGNENPLYKAMQTLATGYKDIKTYGVDAADTIKITGDLVDETYYSMVKQEFVQKVEIRGTFFNRIKENEEPSGIKGVFEGFISKTNLQENGDLEVQIIGIGYEGVAVPVNAIVEKKLVPVFMNKYKVGCNASFNLSILNMVEKTVVTQELGFGEAVEEIIEKRINKISIIGATVPKFTGITAEQIKQGLAIRESKLEKKKEDTINYANNSSTTQTGVGSIQNFGMPDVGFGTPETEFGGAFDAPML